MRQKLLLKTLTCALTIFGAFAASHAAEFSCAVGQGCKPTASCQGTHWQKGSGCSINCLEPCSTDPAELCFSGSATCKSS